MDIEYSNVRIGATPTGERVVRDATIVIATDDGPFHTSFAYDSSTHNRPYIPAGTTRLLDLATPFSVPTFEKAVQMTDALHLARHKLTEIARENDLTYTTTGAHYNYSFNESLVPSKDPHPNVEPAETDATTFAYYTSEIRASVAVLDPFDNIHQFTYGTGGSEKGYNLIRGYTPYSTPTIEQMTASIEALREAEHMIIEHGDAPLRRDTHLNLSERPSLPLTDEELNAAPMLEPVERITWERESEQN